MDAEARAAHVVLDDVHRASAARARSVARSPVTVEVAVERMEEPERRVGGVVQALVLALGKHVGDEPVAHVMGERAQDLAGLDVAAGDERQALPG